MMRPDVHLSLAEMLERAVSLYGERAFLAFTNGSSFTYREMEDAAALPKTPSLKVEKYRLRQLGRHGLTDTTWDAERGRPLGKTRTGSDS